MSLSVVDYTGDYINKIILPEDPVLLIICDEFCLVPDNLKAVLLISLDYSKFSSPGVYIFRIPNDFYRGITYGHIYTFCQSAKFYTARFDMLSACIPSENLVDWDMPYKSISHRAARLDKTCETFKENTIFDQIYLESLNKFTKMFLLSKFNRHVKTKSLKSQLKNLVEGNLASFGKRSGSFIDISADTLVDIIFNDLENAGVFMCGMNVHYNDAVIDEYFGEFKSKAFVPRHKMNHLGPKVTEKSLNSSKTRKLATANHSFSGNSTIDTSEEKNCSAYEKQDKIFKSLPLVQPQTIQTKHEIENHLKLCTNKPSVVSQSIPSKRKELKKIEEIILSDFESQPRAKSEYYPIISTPISLINLQNSWEYHENKVLLQVFKSVSENQSQIDNILKLFRTCNRTIRDYIQEFQVQIEDAKIAEIVRKLTKKTAENFFKAESSQSISDLCSKLESNGSVKLYQKSN